MAVVDLVVGLGTGHADLGCIDHDDEIAGVDMRGEFGLVLATQASGDLGGETAQHLVSTIDHIPVALNLLCFSGESLHVAWR